ncbi:MAG: DoxX family protein [Sphingobacteriia bacterium]|nr:DoxX family protein [Sphingobacteriia bacterium]
MQSEKTKTIIYWALTGLVAFIFLGSAAGKLIGNEDAIKMASGFGLNAKTYALLGMVELVCLILFVIPRTGILGTLLLAAYMGGAIATHLEHGVSVIAPCIIQVMLFVIAIFRFPELRNRLLNNK